MDDENRRTRELISSTLTYTGFTADELMTFAEDDPRPAHERVMLDVYRDSIREFRPLAEAERRRQNEP